MTLWRTAASTIASRSSGNSSSLPGCVIWSTSGCAMTRRSASVLRARSGLSNPVCGWKPTATKSSQPRIRSGRSSPFSESSERLASQPLSSRTPSSTLGMILRFQKYHGCAPCGTLGAWSVIAMSSRPRARATCAFSVSVENAWPEATVCVCRSASRRMRYSSSIAAATASSSAPSPLTRQRWKPMTNCSMSPPRTAFTLPVSTPLRRSFTSWYG